MKGIFAAARDITSQRMLESQLQASQSYTRSLIESNIDALMTTDTLGIITDVNQQMEKLTGNSREELIGTPFKRYFTDPARAEEGIRSVLREGKVTNYELTATGKGAAAPRSYRTTRRPSRIAKENCRACLPPPAMLPSRKNSKSSCASNRVTCADSSNRRWTV